MTKLQRYKCAFFLTALVLTFLKPLASFPHGQLARGTSVVAMYAHGNLRVSVPYRTAHAGPGRLIAEVLDPDDNIVALSDNPVEVPEGDGAWTRNLQLPAKLAVEDLVWYRLIYQFTYTGESTAATHGCRREDRLCHRRILETRTAGATGESKLVSYHRVWWLREEGARCCWRLPFRFLFAS